MSMQQLAVEEHSLINSDDDDNGHRKAAILALLDRARINRGLQLMQDDGAKAAGQEMELPSSKSEPLEPPKSNPLGRVPTPSPNSMPTSLDILTQTHINPRTETIATDPDFNKHLVTVIAEVDVVPEAKTSPIDLTTTCDSLTEVQSPAKGSKDRVRSPNDDLVVNTTTNYGIPDPFQPEKDLVEHQRRPSSSLETKTSSTTSALIVKPLESLPPDEDDDDTELYGDFRHVVHMLIPSNATTALLERRGEPIQRISQETGCMLSIREPEASPFKDERLLRMIGTPKCICFAQRLVLASIRAFRADKGDPNYLELSANAPLVALPTSSITKVMNVAVTSGHKKDVELTSPFHWLVQRDSVGKMMGKQGTILAAIRRSTGASIHVEESVVCGTTERRVVLTGQEKAIAAAVYEIKSRAGGRPEMVPRGGNGRCGQYYAIPANTVGHLIGPQGATIRDLSERTGARLQLPAAEDLPFGSLNRILHVHGTVKQVEHARRVVLSMVRDYCASFSTNVSSPRNLLAPEKERDHVTMKLLLPSRICTFLLDGRGVLIREISKKSGAHTHFLTPHDPDKQRVWVVTGDLRCVLRAQRLVLQVIAGDTMSLKRTAPPRKRIRGYRVKNEEKEASRDDKEEEEQEGNETIIADVDHTSRHGAKRIVSNAQLEVQEDKAMTSATRSLSNESSSRKVELVAREGRLKHRPIDRRRRSRGRGSGSHSRTERKRSQPGRGLGTKRRRQ